MVILQCSLLQLFGRRISQYRVFFLSPLILCTDYKSCRQSYRLHWVLRSLHRELGLRFPVSHPYVPPFSSIIEWSVSLPPPPQGFRQRLLHTGGLTKLPTRRPLKLLSSTNQPFDFIDKYRSMSNSWYHPLPSLSKPIVVPIFYPTIKRSLCTYVPTSKSITTPRFQPSSTNPSSVNWTAKSTARIIIPSKHSANSHVHSQWLQYHNRSAYPTEVKPITAESVRRRHQHIHPTVKSAALIS